MKKILYALILSCLCACSSSEDLVNEGLDGLWQIETIQIGQGDSTLLLATNAFVFKRSNETIILPMYYYPRTDSLVQVEKVDYDLTNEGKEFYIDIWGNSVIFSEKFKVKFSTDETNRFIKLKLQNSHKVINLKKFELNYLGVKERYNTLQELTDE